MSRVVLIIGGGVVGALALYLSRNAETLEDVAAALDTVATDAVNFVNEGFGFMRVANMRNVQPGVVNNLNVQAMLRVIRNGEGTAGAGGYSLLFGGGRFEGFADHPRIRFYEKNDEFIKNGKKDYTTAAGAYQITESTWDETKRLMGLPDFSPASQDLAAVGRIAARNALDDVIAGRFEMAVKKINREWASLPGSPYGQPVVSWESARRVFLAFGGNDVTGVAV